MLSIEQFRYGSDNFAYVVYGEKQAVAVDGGAGKEIISFLKKNNLSLVFITNTHSHYDHTSGNDYLLETTDAQFLDPSMLPDNHDMIIDEKTITVYKTPGHTDDSVCFHTGNILITGDTLFNATIGNCFSGNQKSFYHSIKRLMSLPDKTMIFAGHDYIRDSLTFARHLEPGNTDIEFFKKILHSRVAVFSTLSEERKINPYLRFNEPLIIDMLKKHNLPFATEWERWNSLMSIE